MNNENLIFNYNKEVFGGTEYMAKNFHEKVLPYAKNFYKALRLGDKQGLKKIHVMQPVGSGLAEAIRDRLCKAASG